MIPFRVNVELFEVQPSYEVKCKALHVNIIRGPHCTLNLFHPATCCIIQTLLMLPSWREGKGEDPKM